MNRPDLNLGIRWTIGDVSTQGYEALQLSVWGMWRIFGTSARYVICLNSIPLHRAQRLAGDLPPQVQWRVVDKTDLPRFLSPYLSAGMAEGVAWKFAPLQIFPDRFEISLDNDCIIWKIPEAMGRWLNSCDRASCLLAEDVKTCFGKFAHHCGSSPKNLGIRGLPPDYDLANAIQTILKLEPVILDSELDEQGLQIAALSREFAPLIVSEQDVSICSPLPPHRPELGRCGAHFVGLNSHQLPWTWFNQDASELTRRNWNTLRPAILDAIFGSAPLEYQSNVSQSTEEG